MDEGTQLMVGALLTFLAVGAGLAACGCLVVLRVRAERRSRRKEEILVELGSPTPRSPGAASSSAPPAMTKEAARQMWEKTIEAVLAQKARAAKEYEQDEIMFRQIQHENAEQAQRERKQDAMLKLAAEHGKIREQQEEMNRQNAQKFQREWAAAMAKGAPAVSSADTLGEAVELLELWLDSAKLPCCRATELRQRTDTFLEELKI